MYNSIEKTKKSVLDDMCQEIDKICSLLTISIDEFIEDKFLAYVNDYIYKYHRMLYFEVTNYILVLLENDEAHSYNLFENMKINISKMINYVESNDFKNLLNSSNKRYRKTLNEEGRGYDGEKK